MYNPLTPEEQRIINGKDTEAPYSGEYEDLYKEGVFICKKCEQPLFSAKAKFNAGCGWPSFDENFPGAVEQIPDTDGFRTEIRCSNCKAHLGHVFTGERFTSKDTRHCVNSLSIKFIPEKNEGNIETVYLGGGCFWCTEAVFNTMEGIISVTPGYAGGDKMEPTYEEVCTGTTGHAEVVKVVFDNTKIPFKEILKIFFKIHDPTSVNQQGNDIGEQYRTIIFYTTLEQKKAIENEIANIGKEYTKPVVTQVRPYVVFFPAEEEHRDYYRKHPENAYCAVVIRPKIEKAKNSLQK